VAWKSWSPKSIFQSPSGFFDFDGESKAMTNNSVASPGELPYPQSITPHLIHGDSALAAALGAGLSTVRTWRAKRLIPFIRTGHRSIAYSLPRVLRALERVEVSEISKPTTRKN
jgi:hypothetical protein